MKHEILSCMSESVIATEVVIPNASTSIVLVTLSRAGGHALGKSRWDVGKEIFLDAVDGVDVRSFPKERRAQLTRLIGLVWPQH